MIKKELNHMEMALSVKVAIIASGAFLFLGMLTGVLKYLQIRKSEHKRAHYYIDIAHRSSLMYSASTLILATLAYFSAWSDQINLWLVLGNIIFFALAIFSYIIHGLLKDTQNQFKQPHTVGAWTLPPILLTLFMVALIIVELGCTLGLLIGATMTLLIV